MEEKTGEKKMMYGQQPNVCRGGDYLFVTQRCGRMDHATGEKFTTIEGQTANLLRKMDSFSLKLKVITERRRFLSTWLFPCRRHTWYE